MRFILLLAAVFFSFDLTKATEKTPDLQKAIQLPVEKYTLKNGLTVLLHQDLTLPLISVHNWYKVGSKDEVVGRTGLAHFFEHMMFKGTKKFNKDTFGKFLNSKGADYNAFTSFDYTGYYINSPAEHLELLLQIESDRMRNLLLDPKEVNSEREVVKEERRMRYDDSIEGGMREKLNDMMYEKLPYHWLPIGYMADLNAASMADFQKFYKSFYSPNNTVLVIAGSFDIDRTKKMIEKYYGSLPREEVVRPKIEEEVEQKQMRRASITREAQAPSVLIGYRLPPAASDDYYALDLLSIILGRGQSSRLYRDLVYEKQMALSAYAYSPGSFLGGQFLIGSGLKPGANVQKSLDILEGHVANLRSKLVSGRELDKARNVLMKDYVDNLKKISDRAHVLANYEVLYGDYSRVFKDLAEYQKVTSQDIRRVAQKYLRPQFRNIVTVQPKKGGG